jgi:ATPase subunit of ABC transporter with duplicated ATPase domains
MRCMFSKLMLEGPNTLMLDEPTNHLDLESITALNNGMVDYKGVLLFTSRDHELTQTVANRIIEIAPKGNLDKLMSYDDYISSETIKEQKAELYA